SSPPPTPARPTDLPLSCVDNLSRIRRHRQADPEGGAFAHAALEADRSAVALDDVLDDRQPQAGALAFFLGGEERLEDARPQRLVDADAGVGDLDHHLV